jgi:hypothetical protein
MPRVMFTISYGIRPEVREQYLAHTARLREQFSRVEGKTYAIYEVRGKKNQFLEVFTAGSMEEFDALEDYKDAGTEGMVGRIQEFIDSHGMKYTTLVEVG